MTYVIHKEVVRRSLIRLRAQKTHTLFAGYLHLQQRVSQLNRTENLQPEFSAFFKQFFYVDRHPLGAPYIKPFVEQKPSAKNLWLNENVAGSYAPSSLRPEQPFRRVVSINVENKIYSLRDDHAGLAFKHLLYEARIRAADLAVVLYRNYGIHGDPPTPDDLVNIFAYEFGYTAEPGGLPDQDFRTLYDSQIAEIYGEEWLERV